MRINAASVIQVMRSNRTLLELVPLPLFAAVRARLNPRRRPVTETDTGHVDPVPHGVRLAFRNCVTRESALWVTNEERKVGEGRLGLRVRIREPRIADRGARMR